MNHIWLVLIVLFVIWLIDKVLSKFPDSSEKSNRSQSSINEKIRRMERGAFSDEELMSLLPNQRVLAIQIVKERFAMNIREAKDYVAGVEKKMIENRGKINLKPLDGESIARFGDADSKEGIVEDKLVKIEPENKEML